MQVEVTIPERIELSDILEFVIHPVARSIEVHLASGASHSLPTEEFMDFFNNTMTATQRTIIKEFVLQLTALAVGVDPSKITGGFAD